MAFPMAPLAIVYVRSPERRRRWVLSFRLSRLRQWGGRTFAVRLGILPLVLLFCAILIAFDVTYIWRLLTRDLAEAAKETANLAQSLGQQAEDTMRTADLTLI